MTEDPDLFSWRPRTRADKIREEFERFHADNPMVWDLFQRFSLEVVESGRKHYSASAIFERIRWHVEIETTGEFKLCNNYRAYYARLFHQHHPNLAGFFRNRELVSARRR